MATTTYTVSNLGIAPVRLAPKANATQTSELAEGATIDLDADYKETTDGYIWGRFEVESQIPDFHGTNYRYVAISDETAAHVYLTAAA